MVILSKGNFNINNLIQVIVLMLLLVFIGFILLLLYYRFSHFGKKVDFHETSGKEEENLCPRDWEKQMLELAENQNQVKLIRYSFVLDDYNQIAYKKLNKIRDSISEIPNDILSLIPAAKWLFDNFQMMYREIKKVRTSGTSYAVLPILITKQYRGFPRIYIVAKKMVALCNGHINEDNISVMLKAYQQKIALTDKEIWVLPEMLGFCLLEEIIKISGEILRLIQIKSDADRFLKEKLESGQEVADISLLLSDINQYTRKKSSLDRKSCVCFLKGEQEIYSFHAHVLYLLRNMSYDVESIQRYLNYHCNSAGKIVHTNDIFQEEGRIESCLETRIRALIVSLRDINELDEERFFEEYSYQERILGKDPEGIYQKMDSEAKGMYRGVIVKLSLRYKIDEEKIADTCLALAEEGRSELHCPHHVGTYLLGKGYPILKATVLGKPMPKLLQHKRNRKGYLYFSSLLLIFFLAFTLLAYAVIKLGDVRSTGAVVLSFFISMPMLLGIALEINNFIFTRTIMVKKIPSLNYQSEIPETAKTFVVMPVIVSSREQGLEYLNRLQKHYLANRQSNLYFALLVDYEDSEEEFLPKDEEIKASLVFRIKELNEQYPSVQQRFSLFIRRRQWNPSESCYMGWERKRGKLEEFNQLLCGAAKEETSYSYLHCNEESLRSFRYVITLDADTNLLRDNAAKLVGLIDHPLNRPVLDESNQKVKEGYVIIQPSVRNHIAGRKGSHFAKIFGGDSGLAHYGAVISDIYQDIFNEGIYTGKGIYDVKAFYKLLHKKVPENRILSHDLFESCYARTAFSSNAKVMDSFPSSVIAFAKREHRWIRGDWQLLPWLFFKKTTDGKALCALAKWKIFDNLRRSMVPLSKTLFLLLSYLLFPKAWYLWILPIFFNDIFGLINLTFATLSQKLFRPKLVLVYKGFIKALGIMVKRALLEFTLTPYRAYIATDAMLRTMYRLLISKKNLLRWNTAEAVDSSIINTRRGYFLTMMSSYIPVILLYLLILIIPVDVVGKLLAAGVGLVWALAYLIAYYISQPMVSRKEQMQDTELLLETARRTWRFFKTYSTEERHFLCPDNYQMTQMEKVSEKTSPTNIGLQFLAIISAYDFGFETVSQTVQSGEQLLDTVQKLVKWKGHLFNWYHITTLEVLNPAYISTVDSGNFLGHLLTFKNGLLKLLEQPLYSPAFIKELRYLLKQSNIELQQEKGYRIVHKLQEEYHTIGDLIADITEIWDSMTEELSRREGNRRMMSACKRTREFLEIVDRMVNEVCNLQLREESLVHCPSLKMIAEKEKHGAALQCRIQSICHNIDNILENADFSALFNHQRMLFHIGYQVDTNQLDAGCYDLMASESALTSLYAIAAAQVPLKHWYKLGRPLTIVKGIPCFVSWSGTMFEYLMPNLVFKEYEGSVFAQTSEAVVLQQMHYAKEVGIPWGISESQYNRFDLDANYQYKAFGVPKIRLQPVRKNSLVSTPYATMLALDITDKECLDNLKRLQSLGAFGEFGFYESIDFNLPSTLDRTPYCIVRSYMAHHQGMILAAINNYLHQGILRERFHAEPIIKAVEVLLEEKRQSHLISLAKRGYTIKIGKPLFREDGYSSRYINSLAPTIPAVNYLSNGRYSLMITSDGDGFSKYEDRMLYRFRADVYANTGSYIYIKDKKADKLWSTAYHPTLTEPEEYQTVFTPYQAEFKRRDGDISTHTLVSLDADHDLEIRKLIITNQGKEEKRLEITSYMEMVGDTHLAELSHPAFNKLFLESDYLEEERIFLTKRRGDGSGEKPYMLHMLRTDKKLCKKLEYENDRKRFIGRNNTLANPESVVNSISLSNRSGFCNDPIMSIRAEFCLNAGEAVTLAFITGVCSSKEEARQIGEELSVSYRIDDILEKYRLQKDIELKYLEISKAQLNAFQELISPIFYPSSLYRGSGELILRNNLNQNNLWRFGISGDQPILLLQVSSINQERMIRDVIKAYEYLRINRILVDLVILTESEHGYLQEVDFLVNELVSSLRIYDNNGGKPSFFMLHTYELSQSELDLLHTVARVVFSSETGIYFRNVKDNLFEMLEEYEG